MLASGCHISASVIMRTIVNLPEDQIAALAEVCRREGLSRTEAVRRAVADYLVARQTIGREEVFGIWRGRGIDGLDYEQTLRGEWR